MFHMEKTGWKISELRKSRNITQMELADKLGISFQAVSNWERGNSMPDIAKLPELAQLFEVTIDELLGEESKLLKSIVSDDISDYSQANEITPAELTEIAPLLKPDQVDSIVERIDMENCLDEIEDLLPFLGKDIVDNLAMKMAEEGKCHELGTLAPFASQKTIDDIASKFIQEEKIIAEIVPFVRREKINELALTLYQRCGLSSLEEYDILSFVSKKHLEQIAEVEYEIRGLKNFESIAPFLNRDYLNNLAQKAIQRDGIKAISNIAPFLSKDVLTQFVKEKYL